MWAMARRLRQDSRKPMSDKFIPTFVQASDDLVVKDDEGIEHHPHAGEWVRFRRDVPWRMVRIAPDMPNSEYCPLIIGLLTRQIIDWNWTGDDGQPLPQPGDSAFVDRLWDLGDYEREWLRANCWQRNLPNPPNSP